MEQTVKPALLKAVWTWHPMLDAYVKAACEKSRATDGDEPHGKSFVIANRLKMRQRHENDATATAI